MTTPAVSINQTVSSAGTRVLTYNNGSSSSSVYSNPVDKRVYIQRPASVNNPISHNWRRPFQYYRTQWNQQSVPGIVHQHYQGSYPGLGLVQETWFKDSFWAVNSFPLSGGHPPSFLEDLALVKALNKLKGSDVNLGVALAEARQTAKLLTKGTKNIVNDVVTFRRDSPRDWESVRRYQSRRALRTRDAWKKIPRRWLELQYGWKPLMSDIFGACHSLERTWNQHFPLVGVQASSFRTEKSRRTGGGQYGSSRVEESDFMHSFKVSLYFQLTTLWLAQFNALGLINPALIVWEKTSFSYVVDWILPIGSWLSALDADLGYSFKGGSGTAVTRGRARIVQETVLRKAANWIPTSSGSRVDSQYFSMNRKRYVSTPVPGLHFKNPLSGIHVANAMSLLAAAFQR